MDWDDDMPLPSIKSEIQSKLSEQIILLYGIPKLGKSTLASKFPDAFFMATEAGLKGLSVFKEDVRSWEKFLEVCKDLSTQKHGFKTTVIDTVDNLFKFCSDYICKKLGVMHESDAAWGKGFSLVKNEFQRTLTKLSLLNAGLIMISHARETEVETRTGKIKKMIPTLPLGAREIVLGMADLVLYGDIEPIKDDTDKIISWRRVLRTKPTSFYEAGGRSPRLKDMPDSLDLDYDVLLKSFEGGS